MTSDELKNAIKIRYEIDELCALKLLRGEASQSTEIILTLGLTREIIRQALSRLEHDRAKQVVLSSILCATRFKYYESGELLATSCARCGEEDSFTHLLHCAGMRAPAPKTDPEEIIEFLTILTHRAHEINAGLPIPRRTTGITLQDAVQD